MKRNQAQIKRRNKNKKQQQLIAHESDPYTVIPRHCVQVTRDWKLRFLANAGNVNVPFLASDLNQMLGVIALTATTSAYFANCFRLKRVRMWSLTTAVGVPTTIALAWPNQPVAGNNFLASPPKTTSDTSGSIDRYAFIDVKPPKNSAWQNNWWNALTVGTAFIATYPTGTVIEFSFQFFIDDYGVLAIGPVLIGATPGSIYHFTTHNLTVEQPLNAIA